MKMKHRWFILLGILAACLMIGFFLMGREITVTVDGTSSTVSTHAITVRQVLRGMGIDLTEYDRVDPAPGTWLSNVDSITVDRARMFTLWLDPSGSVVQLTVPARTPRALLSAAGITPAEDDLIQVNGSPLGMDDEFPAGSRLVVQYSPAIPISLSKDGQTTLLRSAATTIGQALWQNGIHLKGADSLSVPFNSPLQTALDLTLITASPITIEVDGKTVQSFSAATTVGEALRTSGITLENLDYSIPSEESPLPKDGVIKVIRVREEVVVQQEAIPYEVDYETNPDMELDQMKVTEEGQYGVAITRSRVRYENGVETSRETEASETLVQPVNRKVTYGTKVVYQTLDTEYGTITYYRKVSVHATSYSPCRSGSSSCLNSTSSGDPVKKGVIGTTLEWYYLFAGDQLYVPGYGIGTISDVGGGIPGQYWIDLGYSDADWVNWSQWVTIYFLAPAPANVPEVLP